MEIILDQSKCILVRVVRCSRIKSDFASVLPPELKKNPLFFGTTTRGKYLE